MPRGKRYEAGTKTKIIEAVKASRAKGESFTQQYDAAKSAGYTGKPESLRVLISSAGLTKRRGKRGRPAKAKVAAAASNVAPQAKRRGRPPKVRSGVGLSEIDSIIQREVSSRLNAAIDEAIKALQAIKG